MYFLLICIYKSKIIKVMYLRLRILDKTYYFIFYFIFIFDISMEILNKSFYNIK